MNSKNKGNKFERKIGTWFTKWSGFKFERNRLGSGAWHTNKDAASDITCTDPKHGHRCKLAIECKSYKDIKFEHVLLGNKGCDIIKFWSQVIEDAKRTQKYPILCMRYNSMPSDEFFFVISEQASTFINNWYKGNHMILHVPDSDYHLHIYMASGILDVPYKLFHKFVKTSLKTFNHEKE